MNRRGSSAGVSLWLWFTVLFANFAEAMAEGRGKAQADALKAARQNVAAKKMLDKVANLTLKPDLQDLVKHGEATFVSAPDLREDDVVFVEAGDQIPGDGEVIGGVASVDESAITGESAPVIRESGGDRSSVTGGTRVLSDWLDRAHHGESGRNLSRSHDSAWSKGPNAKKLPTKSPSAFCCRRSRSSSCWSAPRCCPIRTTASMQPSKERRSPSRC